MPLPKTLLEMAGAGTAPPALSDSILVLIDCQMEYVDGRLPLSGVAAALGQARRLLRRAREGGAEVVHVVHHGRPGGLFGVDGAGVEIAPEVRPLEGERVISKQLPNAFAATELEGALAAIDRKSVVFGGFMTHMCVSSTVRAALDLGYQSTVVAGACATRDLPDGRGGVIAAAALHQAELAALADRFALIVDDAGAFTA